MLKDIEQHKVEGVAVAVCHEQNELGGKEWNVYLINRTKAPIEGVLVNSSGYGEIKKKKVKTSDLRYFLDVVPAESFRKIEPLTDELLALNNQYWVSYYQDNKLFDKKYIFVQESILEKNLIDIPLLNKQGVMIV